MDIPENIIDIHTHLWSDESGLEPLAGNEQQLLQMADRFKLEKFVVMPLFGGVKPNIQQVRAGNEAAAKLAEKDKRIIPFGRVEAHLGNQALDETKRSVEQLGLRGIKIWISLADDSKLFPVVEYMIGNNLPVLIHALHKATGQLENESDPSHVYSLAKRYPQATIIMAHMGGDFIYGCDTIRNTTNVLTDPSGSYCEAGMLEYAVRTLGADRILFGSDAPGASFVNNFAKVSAANISSDDKYKILHANAARLLS